MTFEFDQWRNRWFLLDNLVLKDFRVRYRNMSLGMAWSVVDPLVMMGILTIVFSEIFPYYTVPHLAVFLLCALVLFNFYSILDNRPLIKRAPCPREVFPIAAGSIAARQAAERASFTLMTGFLVFGLLKQNLVNCI
jgi:ABC-type polysaccharide/polyol phosphate export permease